MYNDMLHRMQVGAGLLSLTPPEIRIRKKGDPAAKKTSL